MIFQWNPAAEGHIAKHNVSVEEAEYVVVHARPPFPREIGDDKQLVWGQSAAGRYLQVIFIYLDDDEVDFRSLSQVDRLRYEASEDEVALIIHAMDMSADQKRQYRRHSRRNP